MSIATAVRHRDVTLDFAAIRLTGDLIFRGAEDPESGELMLLTDETSEHISVRLGAYGLVPAPGNVFIKDWSEHEGLTQSLVDAGLAQIVATFTVGPFASRAYEVKVMN